MNRPKMMAAVAATLALGMAVPALAQQAATTGGTSSYDYSLLLNPHYNYLDLWQAHNRGLSDSQVASASKIAQATGQPFNEVVQKILAGQTFTTLAWNDNLPLADILDTSDEADRIARYQATYQTTGTYAMKNMSSMGTGNQ